VIAAFVACRANVSEAAKRLHVPSGDLRRLVLASPELMAAAFEKEERRLDKAEAILDRELNSDDPRYSAAAAFFVLRNAKRAVARGWRQPDVEVAINNPAPAEKTYIFRRPATERISARPSSSATEKAFLFRAMTRGGAMIALRVKLRRRRR
jgi:hypothetical protein